jgi:hypothetical protein
LIVDLPPQRQRDVVTIAWRGTGSAAGVGRPLT